MKLPHHAFRHGTNLIRVIRFDPGYLGLVHVPWAQPIAFGSLLSFIMFFEGMGGKGYAHHTCHEV